MSRRRQGEIVPVAARTWGACATILWVVALAILVPVGIAVAGPGVLVGGETVIAVCGCPGAALVVVAFLAAWIYYGGIKSVWK